ncbi:MAG: phosphatase PAP2 family protein [Proteobacteria bacterium]|nr:phosphatase PAP2 family protein [Pseudomonadota bacterium]
MFRSPDHFPPRQMAANRLIWLALILTGGVEYALLNLFNIELVIQYKPLFIYLLCVCAAISLFYRFVIHEKALFLLGECIAQIVGSIFVVLLAASMGARMEMPLADDWLLAADHFIGFEWPAHARWLAAQPAWLGEFFRFCYNSYGAQIALLIPLIFFFHHSDYGQRVVMMFYISGMLAALCSTLLPAEGVFMHLGIDPAALTPVVPAAPILHSVGFYNMRHGDMTLIFPSLGLGTFPSLHAIMAVMMIYASIPLERIRWPVIALNICMVIATLFHGGHYLVDVIMGLVIAFTGIYWAERILPPRSQAFSPALNQVAIEGETSPLA